MKDNGFREVMEVMSDQELLHIYNNEQDKYNPLAIKDIENILTERKVDFEKKEFIKVSENTNSYYKQAAVLPLFIGIFLILSNTILNNQGVYLVTSYTEMIMFNIIKRAISLFIIVSITNKCKLNQTVWIILSLIFGSWSLIAINIALWMGVERKHEN